MMDVDLTPHLEELVQQQVASGRYKTADEVICAALRLMEVRDRLREARLVALRQGIQAGLDSPVEPWEGADTIISQAKERRAAQQSQPTE